MVYIVMKKPKKKPHGDGKHKEGNDRTPQILIEEGTEGTEQLDDYYCRSIPLSHTVWVKNEHNLESGRVQKIGIQHLQRESIKKHIDSEDDDDKFEVSNFYLVATACDDGIVRFRYLKVLSKDAIEAMETKTQADTPVTDSSDTEAPVRAESTLEPQASVKGETPTEMPSPSELATQLNEVQSKKTADTWVVMNSKFQKEYVRPNFDNHRSKVFTCAICSENKYLLSCGVDTSVVKYDTLTGKPCMR